MPVHPVVPVCHFTQFGNCAKHLLGRQANFKSGIKNIDAEVINARFVKPLDRELLFDIFSRFEKIITVEDNTIVGGFGSAVSEFAIQNNLKNDILIHGIPDRFIDHAKPEELHEELKLDAKGISEITEEFLLKEKKYEKI